MAFLGEHARNPRLEVQLLNVQIPADYSGHARMLVRQEVGHVAPTILRCASEFGADRIVMGRRGLSALVDRVLGSVASDVSAQAHVPVMLVR